MDDDTLLATCIADEAGSEPYEGKVAVGIVVLNRLIDRIASDGTMQGTVLRPNQFSGFWFAMIHGKYQRTATELSQALAEADKLHAQFSTETFWADCVKAVADAKAWQSGIASRLSFKPGPAFGKLTHKTVLYFNPRVVARPVWATPDKFVATIFRHDFYRN